jgi:hypothetical protein
MVFIPTVFVATASADLELAVQEELLIPDPEVTIAMEIFRGNEEDTEHDRGRGCGNNAEGSEGSVV